MEFNLSIRTGRSEGAAPAPESSSSAPAGESGPTAGKISEALALIKTNYLDAQTPLQEEGVKNAKLSWVGGAVRIFATFTGRSTESVMADVKGATPSTPAPGRYENMVNTAKPVKPSRPTPPPGAPRKLTPEELERPPAPPDDSVSITATAVLPPPRSTD